MSIKHKIIKNTILSGGINVIIAIIGFALIPFIIVHLGVEEFGLIGYVKVFSVLGIIGVFDFGLKQTVTKFVAQYDSNKSSEIRYILSTAIGFLFLISLVLLLVGFLTVKYIVSFLSIPILYIDIFHTALTLIFVSYIFEFPNMVYESLLAGLQRYDYLKFIELSMVVTNAIFTVLLLLYGYGFIELIYLMVAISILKLLIYKFLIYKKWKLSFSLTCFSFYQLKTLLRFALHLFSSQISSILSAHGERVLVAVFLTPVYMAMYEVLIKLPRFLKSSLAFGGIATMPAASELSARNDKKRLNKLFRTGLRFNLMLNYPIIIFAMFMAYDFLLIWVGDEFTELATLLAFMLVFNLLNPLSSYGWSIVLGMGHKLHYIAFIQWFNTAFKFLIWLLLLQYIGLWAVVIASWSILLTIPISLVVHSKEFDVNIGTIFKDTFTVTSAALLPAVIILLFKQIYLVQNFYILLLYGIFWIILAWSIFYLWIMTNNEKHTIDKIIMRFLKVVHI